MSIKLWQNILKTNEYQYHKLCAVAASLHKSPEEVAQNVLIGYLAIVEPAAEDEPVDE